MKNGSKYIGDFINDLKHGLGVITYENGDEYNGEWLAD